MGSSNGRDHFDTLLMLHILIFGVLLSGKLYPFFPFYRNRRILTKNPEFADNNGQEEESCHKDTINEKLFSVGPEKCFSL